MALRRFLGLLRVCVRGRRAMAAAAARSARACAGARLRAIGAQVEVAYTAAVARAEARARASRAFLLRALLQADTAAGVAALHFRRRSDKVVTIFLRLAYGESAPKTPSPLEMLHMLVQLAQRAIDIDTYLTHADKILELFNLVSPYEAWYILSVLCMPIAAYYQNIVSIAPEVACPFLGVRSIEFNECSVAEGLFAIFALSARCGGLVMLYVGGLCLCVCSDMGAMAVGIIGEGSLAEEISNHTDRGSRIALSYFEGQTTVVHYELEWWASEEETIAV